jgi:hypothetical protein
MKVLIKSLQCRMDNETKNVEDAMPSSRERLFCPIVAAHVVHARAGKAEIQTIASNS